MTDLRTFAFLLGLFALLSAGLELPARTPAAASVAAASAAAGGGDHGPSIDPDGLTTPGDHGPSIDPDG